MSAAPDIPSDGLSGKLVRFYWPAFAVVTVAFIAWTFYRGVTGLLDGSRTPSLQEYVWVAAQGFTLLAIAGWAFVFSRPEKKPVPDWLFCTIFVLQLGVIILPDIVREGFGGWLNSTGPYVIGYVVVLLLAPVLRPFVRRLAGIESKHVRVRPLDLSRD